ncbi:hypothetical protein M408DRAFT_329432 [Serendipita vermifera MAFF 305830]|uniref:SMP-30/Gluconolactonase/LRE-like region domain-containing protein n=1 Tax=Serendipita vermifera MAFF 305830 TaxID=933852 RepID=A0A0C2XGT3_SERVB|nr:hypothetical protein M408DRAFT_329432 [Serendipita vermifera MAFF 305830]
MVLKAVGTVSVGLIAILIAVASVWMNPVITLSGLRRSVESIGTGECVTEHTLQACEKMILHKPSGNLYMSCSDPITRTQWTPAVHIRKQPKALPDMDHFAIVDTNLPLSSTSYKKIKLSGLPTSDPKWRGLNLCGLDVVASETDPNLLWVYVINHRPPLSPATAQRDGADSSVEIFRTTVGSGTFEYVRTVEDPEHIITPNDLVGKPDGSGFWVSNDHAVRVGIKRDISVFLPLEGAGIAYCGLQEGCSFAVTGLPGINGISRAPRKTSSDFQDQDIFYAAGHEMSGKVFVLERQSDNSLVLTDSIDIGYVLDNIHVDDDGTLYIAAISRPLDWVQGYMADPINFKTPSAVVRISINPASFYGDKYKVDKIFENNGTIISGATTAVWDANHSRLWIHGLASLGLTSCAISENSGI